MSIFNLLPLMGLVFGIFGGYAAGSHLGTLAGIIGGVLGGGIGFVVGRLPFFVVVVFIKRALGRKSIEQLRSMLRDPNFPAVNPVLLELRSRGENIEQELPLVLEMLIAPDQQRRVRGWHALASAFPE